MATKLKHDSEFVCLLEDGSISDAELHEAILAGGELRTSKRAVEAAVRRGMSQEDAELLYGASAEAEDNSGR